MIFNSWQFLAFFPVIGAGYFILTMRLGSRRPELANTLSQLFLLAGSLFFYACWNPGYLALILLSVAVTWASGLAMDGRKVSQKRLILAASLGINLGILFFFKYYGFFAETVRRFSGGNVQFPIFSILLPVGISFYTFQALGYSMDVYSGRVKAEGNFLTYALFVTFFPQLVAGPIERTGNLLPQFKANHGFDYDRVTAGLRLAGWGMFKKVAIADRLALYVNGVYGDPAAYPATAAALATFFFAFQIYCDFSGYSDIAIGCARVLGFNLRTNFRCPYFSRSITEFWRRWHISLSSWLRDYLYIPLGGNRKGGARQNVNLLITFLLSGLWHGAAWHFVIWGGLHGLFQIAEKSFSKNRKSMFGKSMFSVFITFGLVCFGWIFFRANSMRDAFGIIAKLTALPAEMAGYIRQLPAVGLIGTIRAAFQLGKYVDHPIEFFGLANFGISGICIFVLLIHDALTRKASDAPADIARTPLVLRWAGYYALTLTILLSWNAGQTQFIYFTF
jgi:D-alanyl-lipoteichoic acid acyltransferase DltB (MBOAT superfamily)